MTNPNEGSPRPPSMDGTEDHHDSPLRPDPEGEDDDSFEEVDMIEVIDDDDEDFLRGTTTDQGDLGDIEDEDGEMDDEASVFTGITPDYILSPHMDSAVFCVKWARSGNGTHHLITGGEDDSGNVWDWDAIKTRFPMFKCKGHTDSVVAAGFNHDSSYFSTADLSGVIKVWKFGTKENVVNFEIGDLSWSFWHFASNVLFAGADDGSIYMWKIPAKKDGDCKIFSGSATKSECATLLTDGKRLVSGYADGTVKMFDLKTGETSITFSKPTTRGGVLCIDHHKTHSIIATGSADGIVRVYNTTNGKLIASWNCAPDNQPPSSSESSEDHQKSVESIGFGETDSSSNYLAAGSIKGDIVVWDVTQMTERLRIRQEVGLTKIQWHPILPLVYTGGLDGIIRLIDCRTCKELGNERRYGKHHREILDLDICKDGSKLVSGADDGTVFIWNLNET